MAVTVWKGHLTFGLVSMPIRLVRAARAERVKLRQLYRPAPATVETQGQGPVAVPPRSQAKSTPATPLERLTGKARPAEPLPAQTARLAEAPQQMHIEPVRRVFQAGDEQIAGTDLVKGYEYGKGEYVVLEENELRALAPETSTEIQVIEFVRFQEIDPVYLETSYYVVPGENAEKAYALLLEAMRQTGYAAVAQVTMHRRDHVIILRPGKRGLIGHTMFYPDEVRSTEEFRTDTSLVSDKELDLAKALIAALAQSFDPARFRNAFRERLEQLIESRIAGREVTRVEPRAPAKVIDIMDALRRSLAEAKAVSEIEEAERKPAAAERGPAKGGSKSAKRKPR